MPTPTFEEFVRMHGPNGKMPSDIFDDLFEEEGDRRLEEYQKKYIVFREAFEESRDKWTNNECNYCTPSTFLNLSLLYPHCEYCGRGCNKAEANMPPPLE